MVTEYNRNIIMRRRLEAARAAEELKKSGAVNAAGAKPADVVKESAEIPAQAAEPIPVEVDEQAAVEKKTESAKPRKTDAEKLKKGKK
jgi:hypothetical protein